MLSGLSAIIFHGPPCVHMVGLGSKVGIWEAASDSTEAWWTIVICSKGQYSQMCSKRVIQFLIPPKWIFYHHAHSNQQTDQPEEASANVCGANPLSLWGVSSRAFVWGFDIKIIFSLLLFCESNSLFLPPCFISFFALWFSVFRKLNLIQAKENKDQLRNHVGQ